MKIQVIIPIWKRPEVTKFCFAKLQELIRNSEHEIQVLCIISEDEYTEICDEFDFQWFYFSNDNLGDKINAGIKHALQFFEFDYIMMMNSDSVIKVELFEVYKPYFEREDKFFGVNKVTFVNFYTNEAKDYLYEFSIIGPGKMIHRNLVERMNGKLYPSLNRCLDDNMMQNILRAGIGGKIVPYDGQLVYDIKSDVNIHSWEEFKNAKNVELVWQ